MFKTLLFGFIYAFSRCFYPKRVCAISEIEPVTVLSLVPSWSTHWATGKLVIFVMLQSSLFGDSIKDFNISLVIELEMVIWIQTSVKCIDVNVCNGNPLLLRTSVKRLICHVSSFWSFCPGAVGNPEHHMSDTSHACTRGRIAFPDPRVHVKPVFLWGG